MKAAAKRLRTGSGLSVVHEYSPAIPLVDLAINIRGGSQLDPLGEEGTARMLARLLRRGTKGQKAAEVDERIAQLGGRLVIGVERDALRVYATVLQRNVEPFVALLAGLLREPALRTADFQRDKRRLRSELLESRDDDGAIASRHLKAHLFGEHEYARPVGGDAKSTRRLRLDSVRAMHEGLLRRGNLLFGAAGAIDAAELERLLDRYFGDLPGGRMARPKLGAPNNKRGLRVRIVHKKERSQTQLGIACLGVKRNDKLMSELTVGNTIFGGLFTSRLMHEVRAVRGWSYSAQSFFRVGSERGSWTHWTHPSVENAVACAELQVALMRDFVDEGPSVDEVRQAKRYLIGSRCLDEDTPSRRVELAMEAAYYGRPEDYPAGFSRRMRAVKRKTIADAFQKRIRPQHLALVAVGDKKELRPRFERMAGVDEVTVESVD